LLAEKLDKEAGNRETHRDLAEEVTRFVHDDAALEEPQKISEALFSGNIKDLTIEEIEQGLEHVQTVEITKDGKNSVEWL
ncbi:tyrosine--tRNA ligase, partial [Enterococcus faecalis]